METIPLEAKKREETGKAAIRVLRKQGFVPGVIFGKKTPSAPLVVMGKNLEKALHQGAAHKIVSLRIDAENSGKEKLCIIQEVQRDVFGKTILHVDFHEISMEEKITSKIPLELEGNAPGVKEGGVLEHVLWEVEVEALPINMPEKFTLNISGLTINQSLHVKDIPVIGDIKILEGPEEVVVVVHPPRTEEVAPVAAAPEGVVAAAPAAPAQPEVIAKGKKEEAEGEGTEEKPKK